VGIAVGTAGQRWFRGVILYLFTVSKVSNAGIDVAIVS
jgi:hypothetical protein